MNAIEFICEGCGNQVIGIGYERVPISQLCWICEWMCEHVLDPDEFWAAYTRQRDIGTVASGDTRRRPTRSMT